MSFTGEGFPDYPNLHIDTQEVLNVVEWGDGRHNYKTAQYREFTRRERILPRHMQAARWILDRLEFDGDCRDGIYDIPDDLRQLGDEACNGSDV